MAFEINDLKGILILVLFAIPTVVSTNINCSGRAFHCVNSTHFMICVDLGGGVSTTIDDFVIPCPATTECHENNIFECDFPEVTTPPLQVIDVYKPSDTSESTLVTNSVTTPTPTSAIFSVFKENITATTLPIAEDVTPAVKLEVLENIMNRVGINSDNTTETSVISSFIDSANDFFNDKQTSNNTITTSATDNKHLEHAEKTSIHEAVITSSTDKSTSIDTVTSVIGLINLISTDPPSAVSTKPSSNILTSLDSSNDNVATTTEQFATNKEVTIHGIKVKNVSDKLNISTDIISSEESVITDEVNTIPVRNTLILHDINNKTYSGNQTIAEQNSFGKINNSNKIVLEATTEHVPPIQNVNISKPITLHSHFISAEQKQSKPSANDYINPFLSDTTIITNQFNSKLETTLSKKPVIVEIISTTPIAKVTETNTNSMFSEPTTIASTQISTEKTFDLVTTEATMIYSTETIATSEALFNSDFPEEKQTIVTQTSEIIIPKDLPTVTDNIYQINGELTKNISVDTMNTSKGNSKVYSGTHIINHKIIEPVLLLPPSMKTPTIEITTADTFQKGSISPIIELANESLAISGSSANEPLMKNVKNYTLFNNTTDTVNTAETVTTVINALSSDITSSDPVKNTIVKYLTSQSDIATNPQTGFTSEIIAHKTSEGYTSMDHTTQKAETDSVTKNPESLNQPDNLEAMILPEILNVDQWTISIPDVVSTTTPLPSDVTGNTSISEIEKSGNLDNTSATSFVNTNDESLIIIETTPALNQYVTELPSTTSETVYTIGSTESINMFKQALTNTPNIADIHSISTTEYKIETSTTFSVDTTLHTTHFENVTDIPATTLPHHKLLNQNNYSTTTTTESVGHFTPSTEKTAEYVLDTKNIDFNTSNQTNSVNSTETLKSINGKNSVNVKFLESTEKTNKDESIKIVSVSDIVKSTMPIELLQPTSSNPSLSNDNIKTSESKASSIYISATDNVLDYNSVRVGESVTQKNPEAIMPIVDTEIMDTVLSTPRTHNFSVLEINKAEGQYLSTETSVPRTVELKHIKSTITIVDYVTEKTKGDFSTETMLTQQNSVISLRSVIPDTATPNGFTVYDEVTTIKDNASSTQVKPEVVTDNNIRMSTESPRLTSKVIKPQTAKHNTESSLSSAQKITESTQTTILALDKTRQNLEPGIKVTVSPQYVMPAVNKHIPQSMPSLAILGVTATQITTEPTDAAVFAEPGKTTTDFQQDLMSKVNINNSQSMPSLPKEEAVVAQMTTELLHTTVIAQTTPIAATGKPNQDVLPGMKTLDVPQYATSTVNNNPIPQSISSQFITEASQIPTEPTLTKLLAGTKPLAANGKTNLGVLFGIKSRDYPQYVSSTVGKNISQSKSSLPLVEVTSAQMTIEPTYNTKMSQTTPLAAPRNTDQDILPGIETTDLSQYATTTVTYFNAQSISDITTKTIVDSLTTPDTMKVVGDKESGTHFGETILSDVMFNTPTVDNVKTVKNIIDHESIIVGTISINDAENTSIASARPVDINKAELVNYTESNWMPADVNIDNVKIKESSIEEDYLKSSVLKSGADFRNKTLLPKDGKSVDKIEYRLTTVKRDYKQAESGVPNNAAQLKTIITNENKNAQMNSSVNANIEIIDVKKDDVPVESKNIVDSYGINNNTKANNTSSNHNLSLQNITINDELEQHLISTNHTITITTEVQSHVNESDKQSNKTSNELTFNGTSVHNLNLTSTKFNASSKNTSAITVPASVFNCSNLARGKYSDKKDCRKFYTCIGNLQSVLGTCPNNTVFSEINKQCTRNLSHCVRNNQFRCLFEGRFSDFFKDNIYYICVKNRIHGFIRYKLKCQDNYNLNKDLVKCQKNEEMSTQSGSVSETINDESKPKPKSEKMVSSDDFECEGVGKFPYVTDCSKYYECTKVKSVYRRKIKKCASDEVFDKKKKKCVESDSGEC